MACVNVGLEQLDQCRQVGRVISDLPQRELALRPVTLDRDVRHLTHCDSLLTLYRGHGLLVGPRLKVAPCCLRLRHQGGQHLYKYISNRMRLARLRVQITTPHVGYLVW